MDSLFLLDLILAHILSLKKHVSQPMLARGIRNFKIGFVVKERTGEEPKAN